MEVKRMPIYTKVGDAGKTRDFFGKEVEKDSCLIEVQGKIDELQSWLDVCHAFKCFDKEETDQIEFIQTKLWQLAGEIAMNGEIKKLKNPIISQDVTLLEKWIDKCDVRLDKFLRFRDLYPSLINEARVRCRSLERTLVSYLKEDKIRLEAYKFINRLSDYLFALAYKNESTKNIHSPEKIGRSDRR